MVTTIIEALAALIEIRGHERVSKSNQHRILVNDSEPKYLICQPRHRKTK
jgi:hypothetical protein